MEAFPQQLRIRKREVYDIPHLIWINPQERYRYRLVAVSVNLVRIAEFLGYATLLFAHAPLLNKVLYAVMIG